ncbi:MAG: DUF1761 domain-containing protein [Pseudomonadota bacterium]
MDFAGIAFPGVNGIAVVLAGACSYMFGGVWYNWFGDLWLKSIGRTYEELKAEGGFGAKPMLIALAAQMVMAFVFAGALSYLGKDNVTLVNGVASGLLVWFGFIMMTLITDNQFRAYGWRLTAIDGGHWLGVLMIQGAVIGILGM